MDLFEKVLSWVEYIQKLEKERKQCVLKICGLHQCKDSGGGSDKNILFQCILANPTEAKRNQGGEDNQAYVIKREETLLSQTIKKRRRLAYEDGHEEGYI